MSERQSNLILGIQKDGEMSQFARDTFSRIFGCTIPKYSPADPVMQRIDKLRVFNARNRDLCQRVAEGGVAIAIVGSDQFFNFSDLDRIAVLRRFTSPAWKLVVAAATRRLRRDSLIATQYPLLARRYFDSRNLPEISIVETTGSTEGMTECTVDNRPIDGVVEFVDSGRSLAINGLREIALVCPVVPLLIANSRFINERRIVMHR